MTDTSKEADHAFLNYWKSTHDFDFDTSSRDLYETHARKFFLAGYAALATDRDALVQELVLATDYLRNRLEMIASEAWNIDGRDLKRNLQGMFAEYDDAKVAIAAKDKVREPLSALATARREALEEAKLRVARLSPQNPEGSISDEVLRLAVMEIDALIDNPKGDTHD